MAFPLCFVIKEPEDPDPSADYTSFNEKVIMRAPFKGSNFDGGLPSSVCRVAMLCKQGFIAD